MFDRNKTQADKRAKKNNLPFTSVADLCSLTLPTQPVSCCEYGYEDKIISTFRIDGAEDYIFKSGISRIDSMTKGDKVRGFTDTIYGDFVPDEYRNESFNVN